MHTATGAAQQLFRELLEVMVPAVSGYAAADRRNEQTLREYAHRQGHSSPQRTVAGQAALYALIAAVHAHRSGVSGPLSVRSAVASMTAAERSLHVPPLTEIASAVDVTVDVTDLVRLMGRQPYQDPVGGLYELAVPQADRRQLGQFWTPRPIADLMAAWTVAHPDARVHDPAAGAGMLLLAAMQRLAEHGRARSQIAGQVSGCDIDPLVRALALTAARSSLAGDWDAIALTDALTDGDHTGRYDAIICNPPYTRHHHLSDSYKRRLRTSVRDRLGVQLNGFTSLFAYFFCHCLAVLPDRGRMAFITPAELFDASYAAPIRRHVADHVNLRAVILFGDQFAAFPGVDTAGMITLTEGGTADGRPVKFVQLRSWPGTDALLDALSCDTSLEEAWGQVEIRDRDELRAANKWAVAREHRIVAHPRMVPLAAIATVMRGIATGNNRFFTLTDSERQQRKLPDEVLVPSIAKTRDCVTLTFTVQTHRRMLDAGKKAWLLYLQEPLSDHTDPNVAAYLDAGVKDGVPTGKLVSLRRCWYQVERRTPPPIMFTYLSRGWPRFILNEAGAQNLNGFHSVYPDPEIVSDRTLLHALMAILNSQRVLAQLRGIGRSYGGGTVKVEPRELDMLPVIDPRTLPSDAAGELARLFRAGRTLTPDDFSDVRRQVDETLDAAL